ncbi:MAG: ABC transporter ATP-binding protein [Ghiorsea sp.]
MLIIQSLRLERGDRTLLALLDAEFKTGQIVAVLGPNGAGKSTLLLSILGLHAPSAGVVTLKGKSVYEYSRQALSEHIAWQGDLPPSEFGLTVGQRLSLAAEGDVSQDIHEALTYMELAHLEQRSLAELSSGERQRVEIASTMVRDRPIWLMDEPTAHLDMRHQSDCLKLMKKKAGQGRLIITVLHDLQQAAAVADVIVLLDGKGGVEVGSAAEMLVAQRLEPVFGVELKGSGRELAPVYGV